MDQMMAGREETVDDRTILEFIANSEDPVVTTTEVADFLEFSNPGTIKRLYSLEEEGYLRGKKAGNTNIWWLSDAGVEYIDASDSADS